MLVMYFYTCILMLCVSMLSVKEEEKLCVSMLSVKEEENPRAD